MPWPDALDRTLELPAEPVDDLDPLESTTAGFVERRPKRIQTISRPAPMDEASISEPTDPRAAQVIAARRLAIERREQEHRHALQMEDMRQRHELRHHRRRQESRILAAALVMVVASGVGWIFGPDSEAAKIVFTTSFGALIGYLGGRSRRSGDMR
ncbi:MAG: hypothetical protein AAGF11_54850 [Myxococcota bacterium]